MQPLNKPIGCGRVDEGPPVYAEEKSSPLQNDFATALLLTLTACVIIISVWRDFF